MRKAVILARISDENQLDGFSLDAQIRGAREWCKNRELNIVKEFRFQEAASKAAARKKFQEVISFISLKPKQFILVVEKRDRLLRNFHDQSVIEGLIYQGLEIHFSKENKILNENSDPSEWLVDGVMTSVNMYHSKNLAREARKGMLERVRQGQPVFKPFFGYEFQASSSTNSKRRRKSELHPLPWGKRFYLFCVEQRLQYYSVPEIRRMVIENCLAFFSSDF